MEKVGLVWKKNVRIYMETDRLMENFHELYAFFFC